MPDLSRYRPPGAVIVELSKSRFDLGGRMSGLPFLKMVWSGIHLLYRSLYAMQYLTPLAAGLPKPTMKVHGFPLQEFWT